MLLCLTQTSIPIDRTQPCSDHAVGGHFNPFNVTKSPLRGTQDQYEVGDLSGKFDKLRDLNAFDKEYNDTNMELIAPLSVLGRSIVLHKKDRNLRYYLHKNRMNEDLNLITISEK